MRMENKNIDLCKLNHLTITAENKIVGFIRNCSMSTLADLYKGIFGEDEFLDTFRKEIDNYEKDGSLYRQCYCIFFLQYSGRLFR